MGGVEVDLHFLLTSIIDGSEIQRHAPANLPTRKLPPTPLNRSLCGAHSPSGRLQEQINLLPKLGFETRFVHSVT
jgi:hypothetical protein